MLFGVLAKKAQINSFKMYIFGEPISSVTSQKCDWKWGLREMDESRLELN